MCDRDQRGMSSGSHRMTRRSHLPSPLTIANQPLPIWRRISNRPCVPLRFPSPPGPIVARTHIQRATPRHSHRLGTFNTRRGPERGPHVPNRWTWAQMLPKSTPIRVQKLHSIHMNMKMLQKKTPFSSRAILESRNVVLKSFV